LPEISKLKINFTKEGVEQSEQLMEKSVKHSTIISFVVLLILLSGCQSSTPVCPAVTGVPRYLTDPPTELDATPGSSPTPATVKIGGMTLTVDKVVEGPLCNDVWSGTVYVSCNVQVVAWEEEPLFLKNCNLTIEPGTVVYVAYHNNAAYYNGCSCHTGETTGPYP